MVDSGGVQPVTFSRTCSSCSPCSLISLYSAIIQVKNIVERQTHTHTVFNYWEANSPEWCIRIKNEVRERERLFNYWEANSLEWCNKNKEWAGNQISDKTKSIQLRSIHTNSYTPRWDPTNNHATERVLGVVCKERHWIVRWLAFAVDQNRDQNQDLLRSYFSETIVEVCVINSMVTLIHTFVPRWSSSKFK